MANHVRHLTLSDQFFLEQGSRGASGELSTILNRVTLAGRLIANNVLRAGLEGRLGNTGGVNVQGEEVKKLDEVSNEIFKEVFDRVPVVAGLASEEMDEPHLFEHKDAKYVLLHDPLDGSGNVDVDGSMGTIFSVHRRRDVHAPVGLSDFLRKGSDQVAAGYLLYGPATMFVYTVGGPVHGFTLDRAVGCFFLTHPELRYPSSGGAYSVNEANQAKWPQDVQRMVQCFREGKTQCGARSARYVGALVADFHRTLIQGGVYMYPGESKRPEGKLRLLFEAAPLAFVARHAGGLASDGRGEILDLDAQKLHQRTPLYIGAAQDVAEVVRLLRG
ncbi:MAG: class 1 fructose-bisphosphatase [Planctomycetes bacterium]|nr:class 1 fructose-bisphosphatase [Planctomycetota bacterium]